MDTENDGSRRGELGGELSVTHDEGDVGAAATAAARAEAGRRARAYHALAAAGDRARIEVTADLHTVEHKALEALAGHPAVYQRGGSLVTVRAGERVSIAPLAVSSLRSLLSERAYFYRIAGKDSHEVQIEPPHATALALHERGQWDGVRALRGVVEHPVFCIDGTVCSAPGYDARTGQYLALDEGLTLDVPDEPTQDDAHRARERLEDLVRDFPFATRAHLAAWLAIPLTLLARTGFEGPTPLVMIDANVPAAGKGLAADTAVAVVNGTTLSRQVLSPDEEEQRKTILGVLEEGRNCALFDNLNGALGSQAFDALLTSTVWSSRRLGHSSNVTLDARTLWVVTGNNVVVKDDMGRRILHVRLESPEQNPEERRDFHHALPGYALEHRGELLSAALTILRAWHVAGRPQHGLTPWGSFDGWSGVVREALVFSGAVDPYTARASLREQADTVANALGMLLTGLEELGKRFGGPFLAADVLKVLTDNTRAAEQGSPLLYATLRDALAELVPRPEGDRRLPSVRQLGAQLKKFRGRVWSARKLAHVGEKTDSGVRWAVVAVAPSVATADSAPPSAHESSLSQPHESSTKPQPECHKTGNPDSDDSTSSFHVHAPVYAPAHARAPAGGELSQSVSESASSVGVPSRVRVRL